MTRGSGPMLTELGIWTTPMLLLPRGHALGKMKVFAIAKRHRIPCAPVRDFGEVMHDPHMHERGMLKRIEHDKIGRITVPTSRLRFHGTDRVTTVPSPKLGQHNDDVYGGWLGLWSSEIADLRQSGSDLAQRGSVPGRHLVVFGVAYMRAPGGALTLLAGFRQREMREQAIGGGAVPMHRIRRDVDRIARVEHLRLLALEADPAHAGQTEERLPDRVGVPSGACARCKCNDRTSQARRRLGGDYRILEHNARERLGGASSGSARPGANYSGFYRHGYAPSSGDGSRGPPA